MARPGGALLKCSSSYPPPALTLAADAPRLEGQLSMAGVDGMVSGDIEDIAWVGCKTGLKRTS
jgi:hypothetical protein